MEYLDKGESNMGVDLVDIDSFLDDYLQELHTDQQAGKSWAQPATHATRRCSVAPAFGVGFAAAPAQPSVEPQPSSTFAPSSYGDVHDSGTSGETPGPSFSQDTAPSFSQPYTDSEVDKLNPKKNKAMQEKNRKAQARFRQRQRARLSELEEKVDQLQQQISALQLNAANLESRNNILVRVLQMRDEQIAQLKASLAKPRESSASDDTALAENFQEGLTLTVREGETLMLSAEQVKNMSREGFVKIWKEYINELAVCLVEAERNTNSPASEKLQRLTNEACILVMRVAISNPIGIKRWAASKMEDTVVLPGDESREKWLNVARALAVTESQAGDIVQLRRLFLAKLAVIIRARQEVHAAMTATMPPTPANRTSAVQFLKAHEGIEALKANLRQEHILVLDFVSTLFQNILTPLQVARLFVQSYPWSPDTLAICSWVAVQAGEPDVINHLSHGDHNGNPNVPFLLGNQHVLPPPSTPPLADGNRANGVPLLLPAGSNAQGATGLPAFKSHVGPKVPLGNLHQQQQPGIRVRSNNEASHPTFNALTLSASDLAPKVETMC